MSTPDEQGLRLMAYLCAAMGVFVGIPCLIEFVVRFC